MKRRARNQQVKSRIRTLIKKTRSAIEAKDREGAAARLREVNKALSRAVSKGVLKSNTASRWISRLASSAHAATAK